MRLFVIVVVILLGTFTARAQDSDLTLNIEVAEINGVPKGTIKIELLPELAPLHVERITKLAESGMYNGVVFHRVIDGFMAQTGDVQFGAIDSGQPQYWGMGGSDLPNLEGEFTDAPFMRGTVGMARAMDPNSANSQFFIMFDEAPWLNNDYTVFGQVIGGFDAVEAIKRGDSARNGSVSEPDYMARVWVEGDTLALAQ